MLLDSQIEYIDELVNYPIKRYIPPILENISNFHFDINCLEFALYAIKILQENINYYSTESISLIHNKCKGIQIIQENNNNLFENINLLFIALGCAKEIQEIYPKLNTNYIINNLVGMQEEATILTKLSKLTGSQEYLFRALELFERVRNESHDKQFKYLAMMNEANLRLDLAIEKIDPKNNCIESIKLSEKSRLFYDENHKYYKGILQNQLNAIMELEVNESYGFELENKKRISKLLEKIEPNTSLNSLKLQLKLIELNINPISCLDEIYSDFQQLKQKTNISDFDYHRAIIFEGLILIKKAQTSQSNFESEVNLSKATRLFVNYRLKNTFEDKYYEAQSLYNEAFARLLIFKITSEYEELNKAINLLNESKDFYETTPMQNQIIHTPIIFYYMALTKKEIYSLKNSLKENYTEIETLLKKAITKFEHRNNYQKILESYLELGKLFYELKKYENAHLYLNKGIELIESMRNSILDLNTKEKFFEKTSEYYELMIETCYNLNDINETLKFVELSKQRIFLDKIINNQVNNINNSKQPNLIKKLKQIENEILKINNKLNNFENYDYNFIKLYEELLKNKEKQKRIIEKIKKEDQEFYNLYFNNIFDYANINLENKTLIEYYYNNESLLIFLVDNEQLKMKKIDFKNSDELFYRLENIILYARNNEEDLNEFNDILHEFYKILIKPIEEYILNDKLIIIPYGQLHNIPFNGLYDKDYLICKYETTLVQSASLVKYLENNYTPKNNNYLVIGNPNGDLKNAENEAKYISNKLNTTPLIFKDATRQNVLKSLENKKIIHFAGHGEFDFNKPKNSLLKLYDEPLFLVDLENKTINSELIVLSACETGLVSATHDENQGFTNYLQIDGARFIIAPLWSVDSKCCEQLFNKFYEKTGEYSSKLRLSQLDLKKSHNVYSWGAFQIYGL